jgi:uncharacterized membrane protein
MTSVTKKKTVKSESPFSLIVVSFCVGIIALIQNKYGMMSDIGNFYQMHFYDGQHIWPFSEKILKGETQIQHPVEYPALTGLIMWLISFLVDPSRLALIEYYRITAIFQIFIFSICIYLIYKISGKKYAYYFIFTPAVLYSLNRNWDIWAIAPMLFAILLFERKNYGLSAILLAISIATKFFPIVLILPIAIIFLRQKNYLAFIKYGVVTLVSWILINLPFAIVNFKGWAYFYEFSAKRGLGSASFYEITSIILNSIEFNLIHFYILNITVFLLVSLFLTKLKQIPNLIESSFFVMFAFILFNKQYSMQYVIWLSALAVLTISQISKRNRESIIYIYILWQAIELAFQYAFFQNILTNIHAKTETPMTIQVSTTAYAYIGLARYLVAVVFTLTLAKHLHSKNSLEDNRG